MMRAEQRLNPPTMASPTQRHSRQHNRICNQRAMIAGRPPSPWPFMGPDRTPRLVGTADPRRFQSRPGFLGPLSVYPQHAGNGCHYLALTVSRIFRKNARRLIRAAAGLCYNPGFTVPGRRIPMLPQDDVASGVWRLLEESYLDSVSNVTGSAANMLGSAKPRSDGPLWTSRRIVPLCQSDARQ